MHLYHEDNGQPPDVPDEVQLFLSGLTALAQEHDIFLHFCPGCQSVSLTGPLKGQFWDQDGNAMEFNPKGRYIGIPGHHAENGEDVSYNVMWTNESPT
jgi:hypothetical protein